MIWSAHYIENEAFREAIEKFIEDEYITCREAIDVLPSLDNLVELSKYSLEPNTLYQKLSRNKSKILTN